MYSPAPMRIWHHLGRWRQRVGTLSPLTVLTLGFAAFVIYGFPGYMSTDSVAQLTEARNMGMVERLPWCYRPPSKRSTATTR